jgi:hypothetical protein
LFNTTVLVGVAAWGEKEKRYQKIYLDSADCCLYLALLFRGISWATFSIYVGQKELDYHYPCLSPFLELKRIIDEKVSL